MDVPHFFQSSEPSCGPTCLRMIMAALGASLDESVIAQHCGLTPLGCTAEDMSDGAKALGMNAELLPIHDDAEATAALSNQVPFLAMIDLAALSRSATLFSWHFVVALALQSDEVKYHDPADGPDRRVKLADFLTAWATAGYRGVRVWTP
jgi:ABC-type bacteriocin/lantibiotic exporter with double-glycine peptidase domain